jgi:hypothetical protein
MQEIPKATEEETLEEAFITAFEEDAELRETLERMTGSSSETIRADWSCCIHVKSN